MATTSELYPETIGGAFEWAVHRLNDQGFTESADEAVKLWSSVGGDPLAPHVDKDAGVDDGFWRRYHAAVLSRAGGAPLAYATGVAGFRKLDLVVDARVLIPRPETEGLVQLALDWAVTSDCSGWAADVGTGSGCIALSLAVEGPFAGVLGVDTSEDALEVARHNLDAVRPETPVEFRHGDGIEPLRDESIDLVISNPPYLTVSEFKMLAAGVREHEPREALVSGEDGLFHTRRLLESAMNVLNPGGLLALELDSRRAPLCLEAAVRFGWSNARVEQDLFGRDRYLLANSSGSVAV